VKPRPIGVSELPKKARHSTIQYYTQQSVITDPGIYSHLFDRLPHDLSNLVKTVQGLVLSLPWEDAYDLDTPRERHNEIYLRKVPEMLKRIVELDSSPLTVRRPPEKRKVSLCRDFAVLLVSMLRYQNVPARVRVGFAGYYRAEIPRYWDHRIAEYWNKESKRWVFVDAMTEEPILERLRFRIDPLNIDTSSQLLLAGNVWQKCRAGKAKLQEFGDSPDDLGMPPIRYALLHDFDCLNKNELIGFDAWHTLINKPESEVTEEEKTLLDKVAEMTNHDDSNFSGLRELYQATSYGQTIQSRLLSSGF
jgi:excinuclease ABC subunit A